MPETTEKTVTVPGISCGHCVATIERELGGVAGVESVEAEQETKRVTVRWRDAETGWNPIADRLREAGYPPAES